MKSLFSNSQRFSFRKSTIGLVSILLGTVLFTTGAVTLAEEEASSTTTTEIATGEQGFPEIPVPVIPGNFADRETVPFQEVNPGDGEQHYEELVLYKDLGSIKLVDQKTGKTLAEKVYENDPVNPTRAAATELPELPAGYEYVDAGATQKTGTVEVRIYKNKGLQDDPSTPDVDESKESDLIVESTKEITNPLTSSNGKLIFTPENDQVVAGADRSYAQGNNLIFYIREIASETPEEPETPTTTTPETPTTTTPETPTTTTPETPTTTTPETPRTPEKPVVPAKELPNTGEQSSVLTVVMGAIFGLAGIGFVTKNRKQEN